MCMYDHTCALLLPKPCMLHHQLSISTSPIGIQSPKRTGICSAAARASSLSRCSKSARSSRTLKGAMLAYAVGCVLVWWKPAGGRDASVCFVFVLVCLWISMHMVWVVRVTWIFEIGM